MGPLILIFTRIKIKWDHQPRVEHFECGSVFKFQLALVHEETLRACMRADVCECAPANVNVMLPHTILPFDANSNLQLDCSRQSDGGRVLMSSGFHSQILEVLGYMATYNLGYSGKRFAGNRLRSALKSTVPHSRATCRVANCSSQQRSSHQ
jgi:hypothetical protein